MNECGCGNAECGNQRDGKEGGIRNAEIKKRGASEFGSRNAEWGRQEKRNAFTLLAYD